jgi:hypothetical protein
MITASSSRRATDAIVGDNGHDNAAYPAESVCGKSGTLTLTNAADDHSDKAAPGALARSDRRARHVVIVNVCERIYAMDSGTRGSLVTSDRPQVSSPTR